MTVIDVVWTARDAEQRSYKQDEAVVVFDILRATTTMTAALAAGARAVVAVGNVEAALRYRQALKPPPVLAGEDQLHPLPGFDLGNSPLEFTRDRVAGRTVVLCTTNGTRAAAAAMGGGCRRLFVASLRNRTATARALAQGLNASAGAHGSEQRLTLICAGTRGQFSLDDALGAGALIQALWAVVAGPGGGPWAGAGHVLPEQAGEAAGEPFHLTDAARACLWLWQAAQDRVFQELARCHHGRLLQEAGFRDDLHYAAQVDAEAFAIAWQPAPAGAAPFDTGWFVATHFPGNGGVSRRDASPTDGGEQARRHSP